jgi:hypothetical protein
MMQSGAFPQLREVNGKLPIGCTFTGPNAKGIFATANGASGIQRDGGINLLFRLVMPPLAKPYLGLARPTCAKVGVEDLRKIAWRDLLCHYDGF